MGETIAELAERLVAGGLEGLTAAGFYICFFGSGRGAVLAGTGIGILSFAIFGQPGLWPGIFVLSAVWMMLAGGIFMTRQWKELFLAGGVWLMVRSLAFFWPGCGPLQTVSALALLGMTALYLLCRERLYPLWMGTLLCIWLLGGFFDGMVYGEIWQGYVMKAAVYLALGGMIVFQQVYCMRREIQRKIWEESGEKGERNDCIGENRKESEEGGIISGKRRETFGREVNDWRKDAVREVRRLQIFEHDFRHHLDMLGALYEEGDPAEARAYLEDLKQARITGQGQKWGGERELSYVMMAKKEACRKAGIHFSSQILGSPRGIAQMDMTALLLNLLDNAIRACEKAPEPRSIRIMLLARGDLWQIELVNTGVYEPREAEQKSSWRGKAESEGKAEVGGRRIHGIGLISVRQIVDKYQGVFEIRQEGNRVVQKLILTGQLPK